MHLLFPTHGSRPISELLFARSSAVHKCEAIRQQNPCSPWAGWQGSFYLQPHNGSTTNVVLMRKLHRLFCNLLFVSVHLWMLVSIPIHLNQYLSYKKLCKRSTSQFKGIPIMLKLQSFVSRMETQILILCRERPSSSLFFVVNNPSS